MKYNVYSAIPINMGIRMQTILKGKIGTFVGNDTRLLYRCTIEEIDYSRNNIKGSWLGTTPPSKKLDGWIGKFIVGSKHKTRNLHLFKLNDKHYIWLPNTIQIGEEIIVDEKRPSVPEIFDLE